MRKRIITLVLTASLAGALFATMPSALADDPPTGCQADGPLKYQEISAGGQTFYIEDRQFVANDAGTQDGTWVYQESNGVAGLQRGGASQIVPGDAEQEACTNQSVIDGGTADELIF